MINIISENIIELGKDGIILRMRMREIVRGLEKEEEMIIKDYKLRQNKIRGFFDSLNFEEILDVEDIAVNLFKEPLDKEISAKGLRILGKTNLMKADIEKIVNNFKNLDEIFNAEDSQIEKFLGNNTKNFRKEVNHLREQILVGKKV